MILSLEEIHTYYGLVPMLRGVSVTVERGAAVALFGRNGAGKTTILKTVMGLVPPRRGRVRLAGEDISGLPPHLIARRGVAYVPASRGIFSDLTALENIEIVRRRGVLLTAEDVFRRFPKLRDLGDRRGRVLSGGEQQMLAIGRALMLNPTLLLLDEPSQGLAPLVVETVIAMLQDLKGSGVSIVVAEQNVPMALEVADRVVVLDQGSVVHEGPAGEFGRDAALMNRYLGLSVEGT
jgi:branched-chain amino acid transport system ATP-binding protein